jgi:hypothetical protein
MLSAEEGALGTRTRAGVGAVCVMVSVALLAASAPAAAAPRAISGKLSKPGYTVIALATEDRARSVRAAPRRFRLVPPDDTVTLHLRASDGSYAGPIVVGRAGKRAIVGVRAGAKLGKVEVRKGYAKLAKPLARNWIDESRTARAKKGVPIGAGVFGRVRTRKTRVEGDPDLDGVPDALDIDDNGNFLLDNFEPGAAAGALRASQAEQPGAPIYLTAQLVNLPLNETVNASATESLAVADVDDVLRRFGRLKLDVLDGDFAELDCGRPQSRTDPTLGGLVYCTRGGTGSKAFFEPRGPFPGPAGGEFDRDGDGRGTLIDRFFLSHGAASDQIGTGDLLIEQVTADGQLTEYPGTLQLVFVTVPALISFTDNAEPPSGPNAAAISYPVPGPGADGSPGGPGTGSNPFRVAPGPDGDIVVTMTGVRPQRKAAPGDACLEEDPPCQWVDIGRLTYSVGLNCVGDLPDADKCALKYCPPGALKPRHDELTRITFSTNKQGGLADSAPDRRASRANAFTFEVNLSECLRDPRGHELETRPIPWKAGQEREFFFEASNQLDGANQLVYFKR